MARPVVCTFSAAEVGNGWAVTQNGAFYGDYHTREQAVASARAGARALEARGGTACVLVGARNQVLAH